MIVQTLDINLVPVDRQEEGVKVSATWGSSRRKSGVSVAITSITLIDIIFIHHNFNSGLNLYLLS